MTGLRVIAGSAKGRRLVGVPGDTTRPVTDRVKESVFNIIGSDIEGTAFFDLFGGTGAIGIEALSRGANFLRTTDIAAQAVATIHKNLKTTGFSAQADVRRMDVFTLLSQPPDRAFEYIYIAPPQYKDLWQKALRLVDAQTGWLAPDGWVIVQIHPREYTALSLENLEEFDQRKYGSTIVVFYALKSGQ